MPRPDEHPDLIAMGPGEATCDACMYNLFPHAPDSVCEDCALNPMKNSVSAERFLRNAFLRESLLPGEKLVERLMMGMLHEATEQLEEN